MLCAVVPDRMGHEKVSCSTGFLLQFIPRPFESNVSCVRSQAYMMTVRRTRQLHFITVMTMPAWHPLSNGRCCGICPSMPCVQLLASTLESVHPPCTAVNRVKSMQATLHRRACGCLSSGRAFRTSLPSLRSPRAVQDPERSSLLASTPRGTVLKALLGGLILTAGFASTNSSRPVMAAAGSDIEKVHSLLNLQCQALVICWMQRITMPGPNVICESKSRRDGLTLVKASSAAITFSIVHSSTEISSHMVHEAYRQVSRRAMATAHDGGQHTDRGVARF